MAKNIGEQVMQELLRALSRDGVKNSAKMNYASTCSPANARGNSAAHYTARAAHLCVPGRSAA